MHHDASHGMNATSFPAFFNAVLQVSTKAGSVNQRGSDERWLTNAVDGGRGDRRVLVDGSGSLGDPTVDSPSAPYSSSL